MCIRDSNSSLKNSIARSLSVSTEGYELISYLGEIFGEIREEFVVKGAENWLPQTSDMLNYLIRGLEIQEDSLYRISEDSEVNLKMVHQTSALLLDIHWNSKEISKALANP